MSAVDQLSREAGAVASALGPFLGVDLTLVVEAAITQRAGSIAVELSQDVDDRLAAEACLTVMCLLWPHASPEDCGHADWWQTPLGRLCARSLGRDDAESVTHSVAAAMLGVQRGTIAQLVSRGHLDRHPDGGVLRSSVLARLGR